MDSAYKLTQEERKEFAEAYVETLSKANGKSSRKSELTADEKQQIVDYIVRKIENCETCRDAPWRVRRSR